MKKLFLCAALAAMSVCGAASAQIVSGKYILTIQTFCQPTVYVTYNIAVAVNGVGLSSSVHSNDMLLAAFNLGNQTVSFKGFEDTGSVALLNEQPIVGGNVGSPFQENPVSVKPSPYSNTATTITMNGRTSNAIFGQVDKNGVAHYFTWLGVNTNAQGESCSDQGVAVRQ